jgi:hypothetical protein
MKRPAQTLPAPTTFLTLEEVAARWRRQPLTVDRMLRYKFKVPTYRLTAKAHLYALSDIEAIEEKAKHTPPLIVRTSWRKQPPAPGRQGVPPKEAITL